MKYRILLILTLLSLLPAVLISATLSVKQDGSGDYTIIQAALNAANPGDTVLVYPGRYFENLEIDKNNISLMSLESVSGDASYIDSTVIDGGGIQRCVAVARDKKQIIVRGFSITNGFSTGGAGGIGLAVNTSSHLCNLKIFSNTAAIGGGINIGAASVLLSGIYLYDNYALQLGGGLYATSGEGYINSISFDPVNRCSIYNNRAGSGQDIYIQHAISDLELPLDTFSVANPSNYHAAYFSQNPLSNNYRINFDIQNAYYQELDCDLFVSTIGSDDNDGLSPDTALKTIHEAIYRVAADSLHQNTVHILPGEYSRTDNEQIFPIALKSWVKVQGAGIDTTTVIGEPYPDMGYEFSCAVFFSNGEETSFLSDLSITTRNVQSYSSVFSSANSGLTTNFKNLRVYGIGTHEHYTNRSIIIYFSATKKRPSMWENVTIENIEPANVQLLEVYSGILAPGVVSAFSGIFKDCKFRNASSTYVSQSAWAMPLVAIRGDENMVFENCEFHNLTMQDDDSFAIAVGGAQFPQQQNHFVLQNCLFSKNSSQDGVMVFGSNNYPRVDITNCTFADNTSDNYILMVNGDVNITNSIFYNDSPYEIKVHPMEHNPYELTHLTIDHSLVKGGIDGIIPYPRPGNTINFLPSSFDADPLFQGIVVPSNPFHYVLSELSPCIDSGTPDISGLNLPPYDLAGNWRVWNDRIDLGCFEYASEPWVSNDDHVIPQVQHFVLHQNYPNPFNPETTISFELEEPALVSLEVFNARGQKLRTLLNAHYGAGSHSILWDGCDEQGRAVSSGIYFYRMQTALKSQSRKMLLLK